MIITTLRAMFTENLMQNGENWGDVTGITIDIDNYDYSPDLMFVNPQDGDWASVPFWDNHSYEESVTLADVPKNQWLDLRFDKSYGGECPIQVTVWTKKFIYFNYAYDGSDFIISKPRNPPEELQHQ